MRGLTATLCPSPGARPLRGHGASRCSSWAAGQPGDLLEAASSGSPGPRASSSHSTLPGAATWPRNTTTRASELSRWPGYATKRDAEMQGLPRATAPSSTARCQTSSSWAGPPPPCRASRETPAPWTTSASREPGPLRGRTAAPMTGERGHSRLWALQIIH